MNPPASTPSPRRFPIWEMASLLLSAGAVLALFSQIRTYVTGQDPTLYIKLARLVLEQPPGSELFKQGLTQVAPGFTLLLASFMGPFGTAAAYWVAPVCFLLLLPVFRTMAPAAAQQVRALMFIERFAHDVEARFDQLGQ